MGNGCSVRSVLGSKREDEDVEQPGGLINHSECTVHVWIVLFSGRNEKTYLVFLGFHPPRHQETTWLGGEWATELRVAVSWSN